MEALHTARPVPCGSCPYRQDVPSGIWVREEYEKLPQYDGETFEQAMQGATSLFMCHQKEGHLCSGWLACHNPQELFALRVHHQRVDPAVWDYTTDVPVFTSGQEAHDHGIAEIETPGPEAERKMRGLRRLRKED